MTLLQTIEQKKKYICLINQIPFNTTKERLIVIRNYLIQRLERLIKKEKDYTQEFIIKNGKDICFDIPKIQEIISTYYGLTTEQLIAKNRKREIVFPRQVSMYYCKLILKRNYSLSYIGEQHERDHATVLYSIGVIEDLKDSDKEVKKQIDELNYRFGIIN